MNNRRELNDDGTAWVLFRPSGYPHKLKRQLSEAVTDDQVLQLVLPYILSISLPTLSGGVVAKITSMEDMDDVDEPIVMQLLMQFYQFRGERNLAPLSKNSSPPSTDT